MRRHFAVLAIGFASLLCIPAALADKPQKFPLPAGPFQLSAAVCGFPIDFVPLQNNESGKVFSNGTFAVSGALKVRLTNSNTGKSVDLNISGGGTIVPRSDGTALLTSHGPALVFFLPGQLGPGSSGALLFVHGRFMEVLDQIGNPVPGTFTSTGSVEDLCPTLG